MEKQEFLNQLRSFLSTASESRLSDTRILPTNAVDGDIAIEIDFWVQERSFSSAAFPEPTPAGTHIFVRLGKVFRMMDGKPLYVKHDTSFSGCYRFIPDCVSVNTAKGIILGELDEYGSEFFGEVLTVLDGYNQLTGFNKAE